MPSSGGSGGLREIQVMDFLLQNGNVYIPAIIKAYARFTYMPDGSSVYDTLRSMNTDMERLDRLMNTYTQFMNQTFTETISGLETRIADLEQKNAALENRIVALEGK